MTPSTLYVADKAIPGTGLRAEDMVRVGGDGSLTVTTTPGAAAGAAIRAAIASGRLRSIDHTRPSLSLLQGGRR
jgi:hypothetical protein